MLTISGSTTLHETTNPLEAYEFADVLNEVETDLDVEYTVKKGF